MTNRLNQRPLTSVFLTRCCLLLALVFTVGCSNRGVDGVIYGGNIFTGVDEAYVEAVAFDDGKIVFVGDLAGAEALIGVDTQRIELQGQMLIPGLIDAHVHPSLVALFESYPSLESANNVDELIALMQQYAVDVPEDKWVIGFGFPMGMFSDQIPNKHLLDEYFPDRPVALISHHMHNWWLNSAALKSAGIDDTTPNPMGGFIHRMPDSSEPSGFLEDEASFGLLIKDKSLMPSYGAMYDNFVGIFNDMAAQGYVAYMDAGVEQTEVAFAYYLMEVFDKIKLKGSLAMIVLPGMGPERIDQIADIRSWFGSDNLKIDVAKFWIDGNVDTRHAYMEAAYTDTEKSELPRGKAYFSTQVMKEFIQRTEQLQLNTHMHVIGDAALSETLQAFTDLSIQGSFEQRHFFTHLQFANKRDVDQLAALGLGINISPSWAHRDLDGHHGKPIDFTMVEMAVGKRLHEHHLYLPFKTIFESGVQVSSGSDYPFTTLNPFESIETGITRQHYANIYQKNLPASIQPDQKVDLKNLLKSYTLNAAYQVGRENELGSIEVGKSASFAILEQDIFETPIRDISEIKVNRTMIDGETVFSR